MLNLLSRIRALDVKKTPKQNVIVLIVMSIAMFASSDVLAATGLTPVTNFINQIVGWLGGLAIAVVTIALLWCGYILMFNRGNTSQIPYILGGAVIVGGAGTIATWLAGGFTT